MRPRFHAVLLLALASLLLFAPVGTPQPPPTEEPYPATPGAVVQKFLEIAARGLIIHRYSEDRRDSERLFTAKSVVVANFVDLEELTTIALSLPTVSVQTPEASETSATVQSVPAPRRVDWKLVKEDSKWKIDLLATLQALPPDLRPDMSEIEQKLSSANLGAINSLSSIKQLGLALAMYSADYDDHLPVADRWMDGLPKYLGDDRLFHAPSAPEGAFGGYAFNARLSGMRRDQTWAPWRVVVLFETPWTWKNAAGGPAGMPKTSLYGDLGGAVLFADGHAGLVPPGKAMTWDPQDPRYKPQPRPQTGPGGAPPGPSYDWVPGSPNGPRPKRQGGEE